MPVEVEGRPRGDTRGRPRSGYGNATTTYNVRDQFGRVTNHSQTIDGINYAFVYSYNASNNLTSITYPSGRQAVLGETDPGATLSPTQARALAQNVVDVLSKTIPNAEARGTQAFAQAVRNSSQTQVLPS